MKTFPTKLILVAVVILINIFSLHGQNVGIGTLTPDASAILDIESTDKGVLIPRVDTTDVTSPSTGLLVYQTLDNVFYFYNGTKWTEVGTDNLGDHVANQNILLNGNYLSDDGDNEGLKIMNFGGVVIGDDMTNERFEVKVDSAYIVEVEDQNVHVLGTPVTISSVIAGAQSTEVGQTGELSRVDVLIRSIGTTSNFQLEIRSGNDPGAGSILSTENFSFSNTTFDTVVIVLTTPIAVTTGDPLTFIIRRLSGDDGEWQRSDTDVYAGGHSFIDVAGWIPVTTRDFWLTTFIEQVVSSKVSRLAIVSNGNVGVGHNSPDPSAILDVSSINKGILIPSMSSVQKNAIVYPATGLLVFDLTDNVFQYFDGSTWLALNEDADIDSTNELQILSLSNDTIFLENGGFVKLPISAQIKDLDGDTRVMVENSPDEDVIRFFIGNQEKIFIRNNVNGRLIMHVNDASDNTIIGRNTGSGSLGFENTLIGANIGLNMGTSSSFNSSFGSDALGQLTSGISNNAFGYRSLRNNTTGSQNVALGIESLENNVAASGSTALGRSAMKYANNTTSGITTYNTAVGYEALRGSTSPTNNTGVGNTAIGYESMENNSTGDGNVAIGRASLNTNNTGESNTAIGYLSMFNNSTGTNNVALGYNALDWNSFGSNNLAIGYNADVFLNNLQNASAIGANARVDCSNCMVLGGTGTNAVKVGIGLSSPTSSLDVLGNDITLSLTQNTAGTTGQGVQMLLKGKNTSNFIRSAIIGTVPQDNNLTHRTGALEIRPDARINIYKNNSGVTTGDMAMTILNSGNVGIGVSNPTCRLEMVHTGFGFRLKNSSAGSTFFEFWQNGIVAGNLHVYNAASNIGNFNYTTGAYSATSDRKLKNNIADMPGVLETILTLRPKTYAYKTDQTQKSYFGFIAQDVEAIFPHLVTPPDPNSERETNYTMDYSGFGVLAIKAIQEQQDQIESLKEDNKNLRELYETQIQDILHELETINASIRLSDTDK
ncbi:MAG: tail fiber domain-containing protein [Saprospiraceae bacterium]